MERRDKCNFWYQFEETTQASPNSVFLVYQGQEWTYGEFLRQAKQSANYFLDLGIKPDGSAFYCHI